MSRKKSDNDSRAAIDLELSELSDDYIWSEDQKELIQAIRHLTKENEGQKAVIKYQREEIERLTNHLMEKAKQNKIADIDVDEGTLMPLLEAIEEEPSSNGGSKFHHALSSAFHNKNSKYYRLINNFLVVLIFFSVFCVILESVPSLMARWESFFLWSERIVIIIFTIEYVVNIYVAKNKLEYIFGVWGIIDLLAIIPSYFHLMDLRDIKLARTLRVVRFLRTIRMLRILKLAKGTSEQYNLAKNKVYTLRIDLEIYFTTLITVIIIFSTIIYYAERHNPGTCFTSIPAAMWWCVVTITTVGYGDMYPATLAGKVIAALAMIMGLALFGLLMNVIGKAMMTSLFGSSKLD